MQFKSEKKYNSWVRVLRRLRWWVGGRNWSGLACSSRGPPFVLGKLLSLLETWWLVAWLRFAASPTLPVRWRWECRCLRSAAAESASWGSFCTIVPPERSTNKRYYDCDVPQNRLAAYVVIRVGQGKWLHNTLCGKSQMESIIQKTRGNFCKFDSEAFESVIWEMTSHKNQIIEEKLHSWSMTSVVFQGNDILILVIVEVLWLIPFLCRTISAITSHC